jgi:A/G-specific adenine glycosylase
MPRRERPLRRGLAFLLARPDGAILFRRRPSGGLLGGLHELPSSPRREGPLDVERALAHAPLSASWDLHPGTIRHGFTHFVLELALARGRIDGNTAIDDLPGVVWCEPRALGGLALPTLIKKILRLAEIVVPERQ